MKKVRQSKRVALIAAALFYLPLAADPFAYVTNSGSGTVKPIAIPSDVAGVPLTVGFIPEGIAIKPNGIVAYVVNAGDNTVTPVNLATNMSGAPITPAVVAYNLYNNGKLVNSVSALRPLAY